MRCAQRRKRIVSAVAERGYVTRCSKNLHILVWHWLSIYHVPCVSNQTTVPICATAIWIHVLVDTAVFSSWRENVLAGGAGCRHETTEKLFLLLFHVRNENNIWHKRMSGGELGESIFRKIVYVCMSRCGGETPRGNIRIPPAACRATGLFSGRRSRLHAHLSLRFQS